MKLAWISYTTLIRKVGRRNMKTLKLKSLFVGCTVVFLTLLMLSWKGSFVFDFIQGRSGVTSNLVDYQQDSDLPIPVVIVTYMRSGSSFIGDILQANDDAFYLFEPHRPIQFAIRKKITFQYFDGSNRTYDNFLNAAVDTMIDWFTCNFRNLPILYFEDGFLSYSRKAKAYRACVSYKMNNEKLGKPQAKLMCVSVLESLCLKSKYMILKAIRIPLELLEPLMDKFQRMRIIYLLRDPRAVIRSQMAYSVVQKFHLSSNATRYCNRVYRDIIASQRIQKMFIDRFYALTYENLAYDPMKKAEEMYKFLGMELAPKIQSFIKNITSAGNTCHTPLCTVVSNSADYVEKWRKQVSYEFVRIVDQSCAPLYSLMGLQTIPNEKALKDFSFPLHKRRDEYEMGDYRFA